MVMEQAPFGTLQNLLDTGYPFRFEGIVNAARSMFRVSDHPTHLHTDTPHDTRRLIHLITAPLMSFHTHHKHFAPTCLPA